MYWSKCTCIVQLVCIQAVFDVHVKSDVTAGSVLMCFLMQLNSPAAAVPLTPVIYGPDGRIMSAAPPGFIPGPLYGSENERIDICPFFVQGKCSNSMCPMVHPGMAPLKTDVQYSHHSCELHVPHHVHAHTHLLQSHTYDSIWTQR